MIQIRWSDEKRWKDYEPIDHSKPVACQLARLRQSWKNTKRRHNLKYDAELRVRT